MYVAVHIHRGLLAYPQIFIMKINFFQRNLTKHKNFRPQKFWAILSYHIMGKFDGEKWQIYNYPFQEFDKTKFGK